MAYTLQISEKDLPTLSVVATQAMDLINRANATNQDLNDLIRQDPSLAGRVLHIANSPFYGGRFQARKISDAIVRLGLRQLRNILVIAATGELFDATDPVIRALWDHAMAVAATSDRMAAKLDLPETEEAFIAGLLHDIGKFIIYHQHREPYTVLLQESVAKSIPILKLENERFEFFDHVTTGGIAIKKWKLGDSVAEAARFHHVFEQDIPPDLQHKNLISIVSLADMMVSLQGLGLAAHTLEELPDLACADHLRLTDEKIKRFYNSITDICHPDEGAVSMIG